MTPHVHIRQRTFDPCSRLTMHGWSRTLAKELHLRGKLLRWCTDTTTQSIWAQSFIQFRLQVYKPFQVWSTTAPLDPPLDIGPTMRPSDRAFDQWTIQDLWPTIGRLDQPLDHWIDHWTTGQNIEPIEQNHRNFDLEIMQSIIIKRSQLLIPRPIEHRIACPIDPAFVHYLQIRCKPNKWKTHRGHRS